jgi:lysophospholipase L1-like esterase
MGIRRGIRDQRGQGTLDYVGIVVLGAVLVAGIVIGTGSGEPVRQRASTALCEIVNAAGGGGDCGSTSTSTPSGQTPEEQATSGDYVALGDSYSSGEGAGDYLDGTDDEDFWPWGKDPNVCRRSKNAYSASVYAAFDFAGDYSFGACSGGIINDYYNDNHSDNEGEGPQRDHITDDTSLITISMGGNDFGFGDVIQSCVVGGSCATDEHAREVDADIDDQIDRLAQLYQDMAADAPPDARILVIGYPQLFPDAEDITNGGDSFIGEDEQAWLNDRGGHANEAIQEAIRRSGTDVEFVDVSDALKGHEVGTDDPWINDLDLGDWPVSRNSFHPKAEGQAAISELVQQQIRNGP